MGMTFFRQALFGLCLFLSLFHSSGLVAAQLLSATEMQEQLKNVQQAAQELDYAGIITHNNGEMSQSMRLVHMIDGKGERERLVLLDGIEREFLRENNITQCLLPEKQLVIIEPARPDRFPGLLLEQSEHVVNSYQMAQLEQTARIAGRKCQQFELKPVDSMRFGYQLCIDLDTSLLLQLVTLDQQGQPLFQVAFASIDIGSAVNSEELSSPWDYQDWKAISAAMHEIDLAQKGWRIPFPPGFYPVKQVVRSMAHSREVAQLVLSDGLASISIFIEPVSGAGQRLQPEAGKKKGTIFLHRAQIGENWVTLTGDVPLETLQYLAQHTQYVPVVSEN